MICGPVVASGGRAFSGLKGIGKVTLGLFRAGNCVGTVASGGRLLPESNAFGTVKLVPLWTWMTCCTWVM